MIWKSSSEEARPAAFRLPTPLPPSLPVCLPALPFGVASAPGRSHPPPALHFPLLLYSELTPPRYVRFRNGLAFPRLGMTTGWAGVAQPA